MRKAKYIGLGLILMALPFCRLVSAEEPEIVQHVQLGEALAAQGLLEQAIGEYEKALAAGAGSAVFLNRLATLYMQAQQFAKGVEILHRSLREKPGQLPVYSKMGEAFLAQGLLDSALFYVEQARMLAPDASPIYSSLGFLHLQSGALATARTYLDTALQLDANNPEAHRYLGFYFTQVDSLDNAVEHYQKITTIYPEHFEAYNNIAFIYAQQGKYTESLDYYAKAKERTQEPFLIYSINARMEAVRAIMAGKMRARYILVKTRMEATDLLQRIRDGEDFAQLAQQFSLAPNAEDGGDVDFFGPGELLPAFEEAVLQLEVGKVSEVIEIEAGYVIIQRLN